MNTFTILPIDDLVVSTIKKQASKYEIPTTQNSDFLIACTAIANKVKLVTNNKKHFEKYEELEKEFYTIKNH